MPDTELHPAHRGMRSTILGLAINIVLAIVKGTAGIVGHSYALVADAVESSADIVSSVIVWAGLRFSAKPPDENHPYGHGKAEPIATVIVSVFLLAAAIGIAVESVREIRTPHHVPAAFTLAVLVCVIAVKELLFRFVFKVGESVESTAVKGDAWHHRSDALTSLAAFIGISVALIGGSGYESADDWAALFASFIIAYNGCNIMRPALLELTDATPDPEIARHIRELAGGVEGVDGTHNCRVRKMGFDYFADLDVIVDGKMTVVESHRIAHKVQTQIKAALPRVSRVLVHIEPNAPRSQAF